MFWKKNKAEWPDTPFDEIRKRARLLVIDDESFIYLDLFRKHGYSIEQWNDVEDLSRLEQGDFDIILLDIQGVGKSVSHTEQGLGVLRHLRAENPAQIVIAFSATDYSLKYQDFFRLADATLPKSADYVDFQRQVETLLKSRFSKGFYVQKVASAAQGIGVDRQKLEKETSDALERRDTKKLGRFLADKLLTPENIAVALKIVTKGIEVAEKWQK